MSTGPIIIIWPIIIPWLPVSQRNYCPDCTNIILGETNSISAMRLGTDKWVE